MSIRAPVIPLTPIATATALCENQVDLVTLVDGAGSADNGRLVSISDNNEFTTYNLLTIIQ